MNERARRLTGGSSRAKEFVVDDRNVATLTLLTGMGKTLTGLDAAPNSARGEERWRRTLTRGVLSMHCRTRPLSIRWLNRAANCSGPVRGRTAHRRPPPLRIPSSRRRTSPNQSPTTPSRTSPLLGESWRSGMVDDIRPGVRESGRADKRPLDEAPSLYGSVVVLTNRRRCRSSGGCLDRLVELLTEEYGASVIAMTATQPELLSAGDREPFSPVADPDPYYDELTGSTSCFTRPRSRCFPAGQ